jgi:hypothetical protein
MKATPLPAHPMLARCPVCNANVAITRERKLAKHTPPASRAALRKPGSRAQLKTREAHKRATTTCEGSGIEVSDG